MPAGDYDYVRSGKIRRTDGTEANEADGLNADGSRNVQVVGKNLQQAFSIANGQQLSGGYVDLGGKVLVALVLPAGLTATALTFQASSTATGTYQDVYDTNGNLVSVNIGASRVVALTGTALQAISSLQFIKIKLGTAAAAATTIVAIAKG